MLNSIKSFFEQHIENEPQQCETLAALALLLEVITADNHYTEAEQNKFIEIIRDDYSKEDISIEELIALAKEEADGATDLFQFTQLINKHFDPKQKYKLVEQLWKIAYADSVLDSQEDYTVRKICDLIYVSHAEMIKARNAVR